MEISAKTPTLRNNPVFAAILIFLGAICFSAKAIMVKLAYQYEIDSVSLLSLRMVFSVPLFLLILFLKNRRTQKQESIAKKDWFFILATGLCGYYVASLFDFLGLQYVTASMERIILFMYPTIVVLISALVFKEKINRTQVIALVLTYIGITVAFAESLSVENHPKYLLGAFFVFISSFTFAIYIVGSGQLLPRVGTVRFTSIAMVAAGAGILLHHAIWYQWDLFAFPTEVYQLAILMAVFSTVLPAFMVSEGIRIIGANNGAIIGSIGPISTIVLAYIFLDERLGWLQWLGTLLVIGGVLIISLQKHKK